MVYSSFWEHWTVLQAVVSSVLVRRTCDSIPGDANGKVCGTLMNKGRIFFFLFSVISFCSLFLSFFSPSLLLTLNIIINKSS